MRNLLPACVLSLVIAVCAGTHCVAAQDESDDAVLLVGVKPAEPFVIVDETSGKVSGFSIDLINAIAAQMNPPRDVEFRVHRDLAEHLQAVRAEEVELGIAATSYTSDRALTLDFSIPFYQGGLGIVARAEGSGVRFWDVATSPKVLYALLWVMGFLVVCAHIIWLTERGRSNTFDDRWHLGVGQGIWWTIVTMTTVGYGDFVPRKPLSRVLGVLIIVTGVILFGVAVGAFSSALTLQTLRTDIRVPSDLRNKPVAVVQNTIGERALRRRGVEVVRKDTLKSALMAVENGEVVAAVHDVAVLRYHVPRNAPTLVLVGPTFVEHGYGITFPIGSENRREVNVALLELMEGEPSLYQQILDRWFDSP